MLPMVNIGVYFYPVIPTIATRVTISSVCGWTGTGICNEPYQTTLYTGITSSSNPLLLHVVLNSFNGLRYYPSTTSTRSLQLYHYLLLQLMNSIVSARQLAKHNGMTSSMHANYLGFYPPRLSVISNHWFTPRHSRTNRKKKRW